MIGLANGSITSGGNKCVIRCPTKNLPFLKILGEIGREVCRAKEMWGEEFDSKNNLDNWITYVIKYLGKAAAMGATTEEQETNLRKAAGVLIAAIDMLKRQGFAPRHYEGQSQPKSLPEIK